MARTCCAKRVRASNRRGDSIINASPPRCTATVGPNPRNKRPGIFRPPFVMRISSMDPPEFLSQYIIRQSLCLQNIAPSSTTRPPPCGCCPGSPARSMRTTTCCCAHNERPRQQRQNTWERERHAPDRTRGAITNNPPARNRRGVVSRIARRTRVHGYPGTWARVNPRVYCFRE